MGATIRQTSFGKEKGSWLDSLIIGLRFRKIIREIPAGVSLVDFGCGYHGNLLRNLSPIIKNGIGVDLEVSRDKVAANVVLKTGKVDNKINIPSESADIVTILAVIEHVKDPDATLSEAYRILKPGGKLIITTPSERAKPILECLANKLHLISKEEIDDHKRYYDRGKLVDVITKNGFKRSKVTANSFELGLNLFAKVLK